MNKPNLVDPRGLYLQRLTLDTKQASFRAPHDTFMDKNILFSGGATFLVSLAFIRLVIATELSLLFSDPSCFTHLSRPVSADILPETKQFYQKAVLERRGFRPKFSVN